MTFPAGLRMPTLIAIGASLSLSLLTGCQSTDLVHQRPMAELNQKAQALIQAGDVAGAIARLESARDLDPNEPNTTFNLAMAYQSAGKLDSALGLLAQMAEKPASGGPGEAAILRALGITWEAKADQLTTESKQAAPDQGSGNSSPKPSSDADLQKQEAAERAYQTAEDYYRKAIKAGLKDAQIVQQIQALEERHTKQTQAAPL